MLHELTKAKSKQTLKLGPSKTKQGSGIFSMFIPLNSFKNCAWQKNAFEKKGKNRDSLKGFPGFIENQKEGNQRIFTYAPIQMGIKRHLLLGKKSEHLIGSKECRTKSRFVFTPPNFKGFKKVI
ncbi:MAG: hypothetical protein CM15mP12_4590 [Gammaproteobacteria bacterium]|nr:MAG: hypothetical protein CM15mP12_4590 [Gammaproteobacteria bacterium]